MKWIVLFITILVIEIIFLFSSLAPAVFSKHDTQKFEQDLETKDIQYTFTLDDYYSDNAVLESQVNKLYESLSKRQRIAELLMPAVGSNGESLVEVTRLIQTDSIRGVMMLGKGVNKNDIAKLKQTALLYSNSPLLVAIDAEPSLISSRLPATGTIAKTSTYDTIPKMQEVAGVISSFIKDYGFSLNFAPIYDINTNKAVIGSRSSGSTPEQAAPLANAFAETSMSLGIIPTAKHFPGHGNVIGDSHKLLPVISNDLIELDSFKSAIAMGIPVIMTGHLAVEGGVYDTDGLPATLSSVIQKDLLRDELGFRGVVITDAFNMAALQNFSNNELNSLRAGADIILMPQSNIDTVIESVLRATEQDSSFEQEIEQKVKRVLRLKLTTPSI